MKFFFKALLLAGFLVPATLWGQALKIGHVNTQKLLNGMPDVEAANKKLDTLKSKYQKQLEDLQTEFSNKQKDLESITDPLIKETKSADLQRLYQQILEFQQKAQQALQDKQEEFMAPIKKQLTDAVNAVAKEGGYTYVLDSSYGILLYAADSEDLTSLVKKKLDTMGAPSKEGTSPKNTQQKEKKGK